jgi:hypothetical protein
MLPIPSLSIGSTASQFLQHITKQKTSQAAVKASTQTSPGSTVAAGGVKISGAALYGQIEQTVTAALQSAKASGSTKDPNQIVEDSIASLLKNIFSGQTAATAAGPPSPNTQLAFQSALQSAGITAKQFHTDLKNAMEDAQDSLAQPLPTGTTLDVTG